MLLLVTLPTLLYAQEYKYEIGGMAGGSFYMGDANKTALFKNMNPAAGLIFRYNANFRIAFSGNLAWAAVNGSTAGLDNVFLDNRLTAFRRNVFELGGQFEFNFFPYSDKFPYLNTKRLSPYLLVGIGGVFSPDNDAFFTASIPMGVGVKYKLKNRLNLGGEFAVRKLLGDGLDNRQLNNPYGIGGSVFKNKDWYTLMMISLTWDFGTRNTRCNRATTLPVL